MKLRHAAALALVGWYLMLPTTQNLLDWTCSPTRVGRFLLWFSSEDTFARAKRCAREGVTIAKDAPISQWLRGEEFKTLTQCRAKQEEVRKPLPGHEKEMIATALAKQPELARLGISKDDFIRWTEQSRSLATCIATDDPRLKGN